MRNWLKNRSTKLLIPILSGFLVAGAVYASEIYFDFDTNEYVVNENQRYAGSLTMTGNMSLTGDFLANTDQFFVDSSTGNVGVGTISPNAKLDVAGVIRSQGNNYIFQIDAAHGMGPRLQLGDTTNGVAAYFEIGSWGGINNFDSKNRSLALFTTGNSNQLYLHTGGGVGIGTNDPEYRFDVSGGTGIVGRFSGRVIGGNAVNGNEFVTLSQVTGGGGGGGILNAFVQGGNSFGTTAILGTLDANDIEFITGTNGDTRFTIFDDAGLVAEFSGRVRGSNAVNANEFATLGQVTGEIGGAALSLGNAGQVPFMNAGADDLAYSNNFFWDATTSRLGIGTTSPGELLHVEGSAQFGFVGQKIVNRYESSSLGLVMGVVGRSGTNQFGETLGGGGGDGEVNIASTFSSHAFKLGTVESSELQLYTNSSPRLTVLGGGNVGIGTVDPQTKLEVYGGTLRLSSSGGSSYATDFINAHNANNAFRIQNGGTDILHTTSQGHTAITLGNTTSRLVVSPQHQNAYFTANLGVGATSPSYRLDVSGGTGIVGRFSGRVIGGDAVNPDEFVTLSQVTGEIGNAALSLGTAGQVPFVNAGADDLAYSNSLFWDNITGRLGVGLSAPEQQLHVRAGNDGGGIGAQIQNTSLVSGSYAELKLTPSSATDSYVGSTFRAIRGTNARLAISSSGSSSFDEQMSILTDGNVGIGVAVPTYRLDVSDGTGIVGRFSGRVIGGEAQNTNEFATLGQVTGAIGDASHDPVTLAGQNYLSLSGQQITANAINLSGSHVTGILAGARFPALTGDVTTTAGSLATTISNNAVSNAKLRDSAALSVIGRSANSVGDPADIVAGTNGHVLRRSGTTLGFGTISNNSLAAGTYTNITGTGALNAGSITSGFGNINIGTSTVTAGSGVFSGTVSGANAVNPNEFVTLSQLTTEIGDASHDPVTLTGENYLSLMGQQITVGAVNLSGTNVTGTLPVARGGTGATTAAGARTNLGATTVGANLFTMSNPSAIRFLRVNANNTVSALSAADFRAAIGAGTASTYLSLIDTPSTFTAGTIPYTNTAGTALLHSGSLTFNGELLVVDGGLNGGISSPGTGSNSERIGLYAVASGTNSTAFGLSATARGDYSTVVGSGASDTFVASASHVVAVGRSAWARGNNTVVIGSQANTYAVDSIVLGRSATASTGASNVFVAGSSTSPMNNIYFGKGMTNAAPTAFTINGTGGNGSNIVGANINIAGGRGTGTGAGGDIVFQTAPAGSSGSSLNPLVDRITITSGGNVGIGMTPTYRLDVSGGTGIVGRFSGRVIGGNAVNNNEFATLGQVTGAIGNAALSLGTAGQIPFTNAGADDLAYSSGLFWDNATGRLGVGTSAPGAALDVVGGGIALHDQPLMYRGASDSYHRLGYSATYAGINDADYWNFNNVLVFSRGASTPRMVIMGTGEVGIGTSSPSQLLHVNGGTGIVAQFSGRVIGGEAQNTNEFATLGQVTGAIGDASHAPVTLAGQNYLTINNQQITANQISLAGTHVTGTLPVSRGGTGSTSLAANGFLRASGTGGSVVTRTAGQVLSDIGAAAVGRSILAGTGLTGGGTLAADRTISVNFGTAAGTVAQGNDSRIVNGQTAFGWGNHASAGYLTPASIDTSAELAAILTDEVGTGSVVFNTDPVFTNNVRITTHSYLNWGATSGVNGFGLRSNAGVIEFKNSGGSWAPVSAGYVLSGVLEDLYALGAPASDGQFIVATGAGAFAYESGATARTSLGATTVGSNLFTLPNPGAISFLRVNANNTVTALSAADFRTAIGAGTGNGTVTSVATGTGLTGGTITSSGTISVAANGITNSLIRDSAALSVIGRASNSTGDPADIVAGTNGHVLRRSGTTLGFGALDLASASTFSGVLGVARGGTGTGTAFTPGSIVFAGVNGIYAEDNTNFFWNNTTKRLGIGTSTPSSRFHVAGTGETSTFDGNVIFGGGGFSYTQSTNVTSVDNLHLGAISFATDAGMVSWVDMPVSSAPSAGTVMSYTAQLDGNALLTVYGEADGSGGVENTGVGIGTTTPSRRLDILDTINPQLRLTHTTGSLYTDFDTDNLGNLVITPSGGSTLLTGNNWITGNLTSENVITAMQRIDIDYTSADTFSSGLNVRKRGTTGDANAAVTNGTELGYHGFYGWNGSDYARGAYAIAQATENYSVGNHGTSYSIATTQSGQSFASYRLTVDHNGNVGIGTTSPTSLLHVAGTANITGNTTLGGTLTFGADVTLSRGAANRLDLATGDSFNLVSGNLQVAGTTVVTSGRIIRGANGTAAAPTFSFTSDTNTGMYRGGTDILRFSTAGSDRMTILANGNVGIGTNAPSQALHVAGSGIFTSSAQSPQILRLENTYNGASDNSLAFFRSQNGNAIADWSYNGLINFMSPDSAGNDTAFARITAGPTNSTNGSEAGFLQLFVARGGSLINAVEFNHSNAVFNVGNQDLDFVVRSASNNSMLFVDAGNNRVGIGTNAPSQALHVAGSARITGAIYDSSNTTGAVGYVLTSTGTGIDWAPASGGAATYLELSDTPATFTANAIPYTNGTGTGLLHSGNLAFNGTTFSVAGTGFQAGSYGARIANGTAAAPALSFSSDTNTGIYRAGADSISIATNGAERFNIDASGAISVLGNGTNGGYIYGDSAQPFVRLSNTAGTFIGYGDGSTYLQAGSNVLRFFTNGVNRLSINSAGDVSIDNDRVLYNSTSNVLSVENLELGPVSFEADAGYVSWIDMNVTTSASVGSIMAYTAQIDSNPLLTLYSQADGAGGIRRTRVAIGDVAPAVLNSTNIPDGSLIIGNGILCVDDGGGNNCDDASRTAGRIYAESTSVTAIDIAEQFPTKDMDLQPAEIMMFDPENPVFVRRYNEKLFGEIIARYAEENRGPQALDEPVVELDENGDPVILEEEDAETYTIDIDELPTRPTIAGIYSTKPGVLLGGHNAKLYEEEVKAPVALAGRVPLKVNLEGGDIRPGDRIAISNVPGVGRKATTTGWVVGIALEPFNADITDEISSEAEQELALISDLSIKNVDVFEGETREAIEASVQGGAGLLGIRESKVEEKVTKKIEKASVEGVIQVFVETSYWQGPTSLFVSENGNAGLGTTLPRYALDVAGAVAGNQMLVSLASENDETVSDVRTVGEAESFLILDQLRETAVSRYTTENADGTTTDRFGFFKETAPSEILTPDGNALDIERFAGFTVASMKALLAKQTSLEARVATLELAGGINPGSIGEASGSLLAQLGASIYNGVLSFKNLIVENLTVGSSGRPSGITMFDEDTGEPYCVVISGGKTVTRPGACEGSDTPSVTTPPPAPIPTPEPTPEPQPTPDPNPEQTPNPNEPEEPPVEPEETSEPPEPAGGGAGDTPVAGEGGGASDGAGGESQGGEIAGGS